MKSGWRVPLLRLCIESPAARYHGDHVNSSRTRLSRFQLFCSASNPHAEHFRNTEPRMKSAALSRPGSTSRCAQLLVGPNENGVAEGKPKGPLAIVLDSVLSALFLSLAAIGPRPIENVKRL
jgi:hypothetical protein